MSTSHSSAGRTTIGKIVGAHGIKGVLKIRPLTDHPERFFTMDALYVEHKARPPVTLKIADARLNESSGDILISAAGVEDRSAAEAYRGGVITIGDDERAELDEGEYWIDSLIGLSVEDTEIGTRLGTLKDVMQTGANDVYIVETPGGSPKAIPAIEQVIREVDIDAGVMRVKLIDGLWD